MRDPGTLGPGVAASPRRPPSSSQTTESQALADTVGFEVLRRPSLYHAARKKRHHAHHLCRLWRLKAQVKRIPSPRSHFARARPQLARPLLRAVAAPSKLSLLSLACRRPTDRSRPAHCERERGRTPLRAIAAPARRGLVAAGHGSDIACLHSAAACHHAGAARRHGPSKVLTGSPHAAALSPQVRTGSPRASIGWPHASRRSQATMGSPQGRRISQYARRTGPPRARK